MTSSESEISGNESGEDENFIVPPPIEDLFEESDYSRSRSRNGERKAKSDSHNMAPRSTRSNYKKKDRSRRSDERITQEIRSKINKYSRETPKNVYHSYPKERTQDELIEGEKLLREKETEEYENEKSSQEESQEGDSERDYASADAEQYSEGENEETQETLPTKKTKSSKPSQKLEEKKRKLVEKRKTSTYGTSRQQQGEIHDYHSKQQSYQQPEDPNSTFHDPIADVSINLLSDKKKLDQSYQFAPYQPPAPRPAPTQISRGSPKYNENQDEQKQDIPRKVESNTSAFDEEEKLAEAEEAQTVDDDEDDDEEKKAIAKRELKLKKKYRYYLKLMQNREQIQLTDKFELEQPIEEFQLEVARVKREIDIREYVARKWRSFTLVNRLVKLFLSMIDSKEKAYDEWVSQLEKEKTNYEKIFKRIYKVTSNAFKLSPKYQFLQLYADQVLDFFGPIIFRKFWDWKEGKSGNGEAQKDEVEDVLNDKKDVSADIQTLQADLNNKFTALQGQTNTMAQTMMKLMDTMNQQNQQNAQLFFKILSGQQSSPSTLTQLAPMKEPELETKPSLYNPPPPSPPSANQYNHTTKIFDTSDFNGKGNSSQNQIPAPIANPINITTIKTEENFDHPSDDDKEIEVTIAKGDSTLNEIKVPEIFESQPTVDTQSLVFSKAEETRSKKKPFNIYQDPNFAKMVHLDPDQQYDAPDLKNISDILKTFVTPMKDQLASVTKDATKSEHFEIPEDMREQFHDVDEPSDFSESSDDEPIDQTREI